MIGKGGATESDEALFKVPKICNINFRIENDPLPPFGTFPKIHPNWLRHPSLNVGSAKK